MSEDLINVISELLKDNEDKFKEEPFKSDEVNIETYYDLENNKHIKIDFGFENYIISID